MGNASCGVVLPRAFPGRIWYSIDFGGPLMRSGSSVNLSFNERKATEAAAYLLEAQGGPMRQMSYVKLIKLLYLADRKALLRWGCPITTDRYVSMDRGPVLSRVLNLITDPGAPSIWSTVISQPERYEVRLNKQIEKEELSDAEIELLNEILDQYGNMSQWELVDITHDLPEWIDPQGSAIPITYRDILLNAGRTPAEVVVIERELAALETGCSLQPREDVLSKPDSDPTLIRAF
jgi:uncharacterized phage-associated protein